MSAVHSLAWKKILFGGVLALLSALLGTWLMLATWYGIVGFVFCLPILVGTWYCIGGIRLFLDADERFNEHPGSYRVPGNRELTDQHIPHP
jgi:hypothetical protein